MSIQHVVDTELISKPQRVSAAPGALRHRAVLRHCGRMHDVELLERAADRIEELEHVLQKLKAIGD